MPLVGTSTTDDPSYVINMGRSRRRGLTALPARPRRMGDAPLVRRVPDAATAAVRYGMGGPRLPSRGGARCGGGGSRPRQRELVDRSEEAARTRRSRSTATFAMFRSYPLTQQMTQRDDTLGASA